MVGSYTYNGQGERVKKVANAEVIYFHYDQASQLIAESNSTGQVIKEYTYLNGQLLSIWQPENGTTNTYYIHNDHLGTPKAITDAGQNIVWEGLTTPFGQVVNSTGTIINNVRFPGQYFDNETGLHYNYFRYYDPSIGRYITSDPIGLAGGINTYFYANANPLYYTDPYGLFGVADLPTLPQGVVDISAGFGDGVSSILSLGLYNTVDFRNDLGINGGVNECSATYEFSKYAGYALGIGTVGAAGLNGGSNSVFWAGYGAEAEAVNLGTTIGKTPIGYLATKTGIENRTVWAFLSRIFAKNAKETAKVVEKYKSPNTIWNKLEKPILNKNKIPLIYH